MGSISNRVEFEYFIKTSKTLESKPGTSKRSEVSENGKRDIDHNTHEC